MRKRKTKRSLKKRLRFQEKRFNKSLKLFIDNFDLDQPNSSDDLYENDKTNFQRLLSLRWFINDAVYLRHHLNGKWLKIWKKTNYFFDLVDIDSVNYFKNINSVEIRGEMACWAMGEANYSKWWNDDQQPYRTCSYRGTVRGEIRRTNDFCWMETKNSKNKIEDWRGGYFIIEPVKAIFKLAKSPNRNPFYEIEFGKGSTFMKIKG